jgi:hypothetical protein
MDNKAIKFDVGNSIVVFAIIYDFVIILLDYEISVNEISQTGTCQYFKYL